MCGICGIVRLSDDAPPVNAALLQAMTDLMVHRGPDEEGFYTDRMVGLGMRRLSIIDLTEGNQPIHNEDKTIWVVFNGEVFNFRELRKDLESRGHRFYTETDTEVIVHLYEECGDEFVHRLRGMFGIALWDTRNRTLLLVRDRLGIKPVYYCIADGSLLFGSELKTLLLSEGVSRTVDTEAVDLYLTLRYVPSPWTLLKDVRKLSPGSLIKVKDGHITHSQYWDMATAAQTFRDAPHGPGELLARLDESVRARLVSDVPLGVLLSGGVDSSALVSLMADHEPEQIKTFTVGFRGADRLNEFEDARRVAERFGTAHHELEVDESDYVDFLPRFAWHLDEPVGDFSSVAFHYVCKLAREHVTVALSGQGSDELFAGYDRHAAELLSGRYRSVPGFVRNGVIAPLARALPRTQNVKRAVNALGREDFTSRYLGINEVFNLEMKSHVYSDAFADSGVTDSTLELVRAGVPSGNGLSDLQRTLHLDTRYWLGDYLLLYTDKLSMANSLEVRVPFLDHDLVAYAFSLPDEDKIRNGHRKYVFKEAMRGRVPDENLFKKKMGFLAPVNQWLRDDMRDYVAELLLDSGSVGRGYFEASGLRTMLAQHNAGRQDFGRQIFCLVMLEHWHQVFADTPSVTRCSEPPDPACLIVGEGS